MTTDVPESKKNTETTSDTENTTDIETANDMEKTTDTEITVNTESTISKEQTADIDIVDSVDIQSNANTENTIDIELTIGEQLKTKRLELGLTEKDIAISLKISIDQVEALEDSNFDHFLSVTFAKGFLKSYCRLLGLNQVEILDLFNSNRANVESTIKPVDKVHKQTQLGDPIVIFITSVIAAVLVFLVYLWYMESVDPLIPNGNLINDTSEVTPVEEEQASIPALTASVPIVDKSEVNKSSSDEESSKVVEIGSDDPVTVQTTVKSNEPETNNDVSIGLSAETVAILKEAGVSPDDVVRATAVPIKESVTQHETPLASLTDDVVVDFSGDCWTEIRDGSGTILFSGVKTAGSTLSLTGNAPYRVVFGYSSGVASLKYKGEEFDFSSFTRQNLARFELK